MISIVTTANRPAGTAFGKVALVAVVYVVLTSGYLEIDSLVAGTRCHDLSLAIDRMIPLSPRWIWMYLVYYPFCLLPFFFPAVFNERRLFMPIAAGFLVQFLAAWPIFYLFPTHIIHPFVAATFPSGAALRGLYRVDAGYNDFPCLHAANSIYVALVSTIFCRRWQAIVLFVLAGLIALSTLLIKQHFFLDLPAGLALGLGGFMTARAWLAREALANRGVRQNP
jgi:membrane-associated phospholipid phosphatase